jgi:8-oxo-dGTP pyrophosphatase MutT (NUDIX family)
MKKKDDDEKKQYIRPQTCRNCGINGHLYKDCIHPIMSFGIICYRLNENGQLTYLMIQRKDSLSFMEFIRGKYNTSDVVYLKQLISAMTSGERNLLLRKQFDEIWNYAWYQNNASNIKHTSEYMESKYKFDYLNNNNILQNIISNIVSFIEQEQEWGFPKGRRKLKENDIDCAIREFCEETRLAKDDIEIMNHIVPFEEVFYGTNNVLYKHTYYIAKIKNSNKIITIDHNCLEQIREVRALQWFDFDDVQNHINVHNIERHQIISKINEILLKNILKI